MPDTDRQHFIEAHQSAPRRHNIHFSLSPVRNSRVRRYESRLTSVSRHGLSEKERKNESLERPRRRTQTYIHIYSSQRPVPKSNLRQSFGISPWTQKKKKYSVSNQPRSRFTTGRTLQIPHENHQKMTPKYQNLLFKTSTTGNSKEGHSSGKKSVINGWLKRGDIQSAASLFK